MNPNRWIILIALFAARASVGFQYQLVASATPHLRRALGIDIDQIGVLIGAYFITGLFLALPAGMIGARFGARATVLAGLALMTLGGLVAAFTRRLNILVISGRWCGDCVQQCPMLDHLARANPAPRAKPEAPGLDLRFVDRDEHLALSNAYKICGGNRVPTVLFLNEDLELTGLAGDKSLARLRALASRQLGAMCPLPGAPVPPDEIAATLADWCHDVERNHLLVRLSSKLRERHGD